VTSGRQWHSTVTVSHCPVTDERCCGQDQVQRLVRSAFVAHAAGASTGRWCNPPGVAPPPVHVRPRPVQREPDRIDVLDGRVNLTLAGWCYAGHVHSRKRVSMSGCIVNTAIVSDLGRPQSPAQRHRVVMPGAVGHSLAGVGQVLVNVEQRQCRQLAIVIFLAKCLEPGGIKGVRNEWHCRLSGMELRRCRRWAARPDDGELSGRGPPLLLDPLGAHGDRALLGHALATLRRCRRSRAGTPRGACQRTSAGDVRVWAAAIRHGLPLAAWSGSRAVSDGA
jgi:hypothetical protein